MTDFWKDLHGNTGFDPDRDRFVLVVLRGTNVLLEDFTSLLDCARSVPDAAEFDRRLGVPGFLNAKAVKHCDAVREIVGAHLGRPALARDVWPLLRVTNVLSLDLATPTRQTEAHLKSLLAFTAGEGDGVSIAETTWTSLLNLVGQGMPLATSFTSESLPEELRLRHGRVSDSGRGVLRALADHSNLVLAGIRSTIGPEFHLPRGRLVQEVLGQSESARIVLVSGTAGGGKSAVAKAVAGVLTADHFVFSFRAEEFARPHLDEALRNGQIPTNSADLGALLAGQSRKVLLVESVERLMEAATRDAFTDLLTLVGRDPTWRLILTCRDYSAELVRSCFLHGHLHAVVRVPDLDDEELAAVAEALPAISKPLAGGHLRPMLRNPYVLDLALKIAWEADRPLPHSEWEFRDRFWRDVVRAEHSGGGGMPTRREVVFGEVAVRRARALTPYTSCDDLEPQVLDALRRDALIAASPRHDTLVAPAHDVLEDWGILRWIDGRHAHSQGDAAGFASDIGGYPAVRRAFRKWLGECIERDPSAADELFTQAMSGTGLPPGYRDDVLVSLLQSAGAAEFLRRHAQALVADGNRLLFRVIHLLRLACVAKPAWLPAGAGVAGQWREPDGPAWSAVLDLVHLQLGSLAPEACLPLLGLLEDWGLGVSWQTPSPAGRDAAWAIAVWLLPLFARSRSDDYRGRVLSVIAKIPNADPQAFTAMLNGRSKSGRLDDVAEKLRDMLLEGVEGMPACRDLPDAVIAAAREHLIMTGTASITPFGPSHSPFIESAFGIRDSAHSGYFPPSAYRGPFLPLLRYHGGKGVGLILELSNHCANWFGDQRVPRQYVEPPRRITLHFPDGSIRAQWADDRLWCLYRGAMTDGPSCLMCALMALERWLREIGQARPTELDDTLQVLLKRSESVLVTAVVAAVAVAHPPRATETLLVLLASRECVQYDRHRLSQESTARAGLLRSLPRLNSDNDIYHDERKEADEYASRGHDLESAIAVLQFGPHAPRVHRLLDHHAALLPAEELQVEADHVWRLALHRMDVRRHRLESVTPDVATADVAPQSTGLLLIPDPLPAPLETLVRETDSRFKPLGARLALQAWGMAIYNREPDRRHEPARWRSCLAMAQAINWDDAKKTREPAHGADGFVAAACIRDHWDELSAEEQRWCAETVCRGVERYADDWHEHARCQLGSMDADRPSARVLPVLFGKPLGGDLRRRLEKAFIVAVTHAIDEVRRFAAAGVAETLWGIDRELAHRAVWLLAAEAAWVQETHAEEAAKPYAERLHPAVIEACTATGIRAESGDWEISADEELPSFDPLLPAGMAATTLILTILAGAPAEPRAGRAFRELAERLAAWWDAGDDDEDDGHPHLRYEEVSGLEMLLARYLLRAPLDQAQAATLPLLNAVSRHPKEVADLLLKLIGIEDREPNTPQFWALWRLFAERVRMASWLPRVDEDRAAGGEMVSAVFLGPWWKDGIDHWRSLEGYHGEILSFLDSMPNRAAVFEYFVQFLHRIGGRTLPDAFIRVASRLRVDRQSELLRSGNTVFRLARLLERHVYGRPLELKKRKPLRDAILEVLDRLVEHGSSSAFRMRDDFVTPIPSGT